MEHRDPGHAERLADTLAAAGRRRFIGRAAELAALETSLTHPEPVAVLWLSGLGESARQP
jgi:hypothetical protein